MHGRRVWLVAVMVVLTGCTGDDDSAADPSAALPAQGPVTVRIFTRDRPGAEPTVLVAGQARQVAGVDELQLAPLILRRPGSGGVVYVHAPQAGLGGPAGLALSGPIQLSGVWNGQPFAGIAAQATMPPGAHTVALTDVAMVRAGQIATTPRLDIGEDSAEAAGVFLVRPGAPALTAALAALPLDLPTPRLGATVP
jgi:hypothetical protein